VKECQCPKPLPHSTPRRADTCIHCGLWISPEWSSTDENLEAFLLRLGESQFHYGPEGELLTPPWWDDFCAHVRAREAAGRDSFGYEFMRRNNPAEATEEAADGGIYMYLDGLQKLRQGKDTQADVALTAAYHFAQAHRYCRMLLAKDRGNAGPAVDE